MSESVIKISSKPTQIVISSTGAPGKSAYQIAVEHGFVGSEQDWLDSLHGGGDGSGGSGAPGRSAYQIALDNGFVGTVDDWLESLKGEPGTPGAPGEPGEPGIPGTNGNDGADGIDGQDGQDGRSAYQIALANGFVGSEAAWLESLRGPPGVDGVDGNDGTDGTDGNDGQPGDDGPPGLTAYQIAQNHGFAGTEAEWLESLHAAPLVPLFLMDPGAQPTLAQLPDQGMAVNIPDKAFYFRIGSEIHSVEMAPPVPPSNTTLPQVSGNTWSGQVLSCSTGTWVGSMPFTYAYQWLADGTPISGATSSSYSISADVGTEISCRVTVSNAVGAETVTSAPTSVTQAPPSNVTAPALSGTPEPGETLTVSNGGWSGAEHHVYQWMDNGVPIAGATNSSYVVSLPVNSVVYCRVGAVNSGGTTYASSNSFHVRDENSLPVFGSQNSGVGGTFPSSTTRAFASPATIDEAITTQAFYAHFGFGDGTGGVTAGTLWRAMVYADNEGNPGELLATATGTTAASGRWQAIPLELQLEPGTYWLAVACSAGTVNAATVAQGGATAGMRFANGNFNINAPANPWPADSETRNNTLAAFMTYTEGEPVATAPQNTTAPAITGSPLPGAQLSCNTGTWLGTAPITYAYQWLANGATIAGATSSTYTPVQAPGTVITCQVTASNSQGNVSAVSNGITLEAQPDPGDPGDPDPPTGDYAFDGEAAAGMEINGRVASYGTASNTANCFSATPLTGKHYIEMVSTRTGSMAGLALYNEPLTGSMSTSAPPGQWYNQPGMHAALLGWSSGTYANNNLSRQYSNTTSHGAAQTTQRHAICVDATDPAEVKVWVRTPTATPPDPATWLEGGDPATGVDPTLIMEGTGPLHVGATMGAGNSVEWIEPEDQLWQAPDGFDPT